MPAELHEIEAAELEGVKFKFLTNPKANHADTTGRVQSIELEIMALGEPDSSGRRRPVSTGETETIEFDTVISALSQKPDTEFLKSARQSLPLTDWGTASADNDSMHHATTSTVLVILDVVLLRPLKRLPTARKRRMLLSAIFSKGTLNLSLRRSIAARQSVLLRFVKLNTYKSVRNHEQKRIILM
ncbi:anaerobic dehydrogenase [Vibrio variabilis]|uniref:Anaerobic dehydrogenase n=1 Tax=Vibrio variabilis TaxID=990271 RepID=A0ABQ0JFE0_9VIBR|nr:anaerobic dehydrogenase [Vibrio variabilis]